MWYVNYVWNVVQLAVEGCFFMQYFLGTSLWQEESKNKVDSAPLFRNVVNYVWEVFHVVMILEVDHVWLLGIISFK